MRSIKPKIAQRFREAMQKNWFRNTASRVGTFDARCLGSILEKVGFPAIIRPSFTMGGSGGGIAYNRDEYEEICNRGLDLSPTTELLIDESIIGWKEYELEVVRDKTR